MNRLIITAHPSSKWFTHKIADRYSYLAKQNWDNVDIIDLYSDEYKQDFLSFEDQSNINPDEKTEKIQSMISNADDIVFVFPVWWWDAPAILKNFFDVNFYAWFAFEYKDWMPVWLLTWKTSKLYVTSWWPKEYAFPSVEMIWWNAKIKFCWLDLKEILVFDKLDSSKTEQDREKLLDLISIS